MPPHLDQPTEGAPAAPPGAHQEISTGQPGWLVQLTKCACAAARSQLPSQTYVSAAPPLDPRELPRTAAAPACRTTRLLAAGRNDILGCDDATGTCGAPTPGGPAAHSEPRRGGRPLDAVHRERG